jgi:hypothetical protein
MKSKSMIYTKTKYSIIDTTHIGCVVLTLCLKQTTLKFTIGNTWFLFYYIYNVHTLARHNQVELKTA